MRAVIQRVTSGRVTVEGKIVGSIGRGLVVLLGIAGSDTNAEARTLAHKTANLRIFPRLDEDRGGFSVSAVDIGAELLVVSQFTLYADCRRGRRPSFTEAARPEIAEPLVEAFVGELRGLGLRVATGEFQADMQVELNNQGPVTICLDTDQLQRR
jgi:D-aminoacyl-tRNA deacylase